MNTPLLRSGLLLILFSICFIHSLWSQTPTFDCGSNGSYGPLNITAGATVTLQVPNDGIFNCTTVSFGSGSTVKFLNNARNTPVYILATGDVSVSGASGLTIDVSGKAPISGGIAGGLPGPGGFAGGFGTKLGDAQLAGAGNGPGGGKSGIRLSIGVQSAGDGAFRTSTGTNSGPTYGNNLLIPMVGGSGGGGTPWSWYTAPGGGITPYDGAGGGGGGGAILIGSNTRISGASSGSLSIQANGGSRGTTGAGSGSGGAVRLVAPVVTGRFSVTTTTGGGGVGRFRIDALDSTGYIGSAPDSIGSVLMVFPTPLPKLSVIKVAATTIAEGATIPVSISLPTGTPANQNIQVRARDFGGIVPIRILLTPESGDSVTVDATIDNTVNNPATVDVPVTMPINTGVNVQVYTR
jgi:hypothetical protein